MAQSLPPELYVLSVRAPTVHPWGGFQWYDLEEGPGLGGKSIEESLVILSRFLDEVVGAYSIDASKLYLGGFSQGAAMSGALALLEPDRVAGAVMISGYLPPPAAGRAYPPGSGAGRPFFQAHGTVDTVVPLLYARQTRDFLLASGAQLTYREFPIGHEVSAEELQDLDAWLREVLSGAASRP
jgi:phospholipase/carboxylesterase